MTSTRLALGTVAALAAVGLVRRGSASRTRAQAQRLALSHLDYFTPPALRGLDIFAGAGGFTIGALQSGCQIVGVDKYGPAIQTSRRMGLEVVEGRVEQLASRPPAAIKLDLLIGGPPCQPYSAAGKRRGQYDPRQGFDAVVSVLDAWGPTRMVVENVAAFLEPKHRRHREGFLRELKQRYRHVGVWLINSRDWGVPQSRERVFIWAAEVPLDAPWPTHGPQTGRPYVTPREVLPQLVAEGYEYLMAFQGGAVSRSVDEVSRTVTTRRNYYATTEGGLVYRGAGSVPKRKRMILRPEHIQVLQSFPRTFDFAGNLEEKTVQIGNAVPPPMSAAVVAAVTVGLRPRRTSPSELLSSFDLLDESIWVLEPRPWTDKALIGVTTMHPRYPGKLVTVYDSSLVRDAAMDAAIHWLSKDKGISQAKIEGDDALLQQAFDSAMSWLTADKDYSTGSSPVVVPVRTFDNLGLPPATALLSGPELENVVTHAMMANPEFRDTSRGMSRARAQDLALEWFAEVLAEHGEIIPG